MATQESIKGTTEAWEDGSLGRSLEHAAVDVKESAQIDESLGLQMISIRLQKTLLRDLKTIADYHGIGYQPMIRDLLNRFARAEVKSILRLRLTEAEKQLKEAEEVTEGPVAEFFQARKRA